MEPEENIMRGRARTFKKKYGITADFLSESDLSDIIIQMKIGHIDQDTISRLFHELDKNDDGKVGVNEFIESVHHFLEQPAAGKDSEYMDIFKQIQEGMISKAEMVTIKLKRLKEKALFKEDSSSVEDIDWILTSLTNDMYEPDFEEVLQRGQSANMSNELNYIFNFSHANELHKRNEDIKKVSDQSKKLKTLSYFKRLVQSQNIIGLSQGIINSISSRKSSSLSDLSLQVATQVASLLNNLDSFDFNIFELNNLLEKKTLHYMLYEILNKDNFFDEVVCEEKYKNFVKQISEGYNRNNAYHNDLHAGDVMQTTFVMIQKGDLIEKLELSDYDYVAVILAAACHDFKHNGFNNSYHINDKSMIAITYNDCSVLENFHVAETFKVMVQEDNNLLQNLNQEQWRMVRRRMIDCILATDMANHSKHLAALKNKMETFDIKAGNNISKLLFRDNISKNYENQQSVLGMLIHGSDISNPAKPVDVYNKWVENVFLEFFNQGDIEKQKGLPVSLLCDRQTTSVSKSQIGFINFVVGPTYEALVNLLPEIIPYQDQIKANLKTYEVLAREEDEKKAGKK